MTPGSIRMLNAAFFDHGPHSEGGVGESSKNGLPVLLPPVFSLGPSARGTLRVRMSTMLGPLRR